MLLGWSRRKRWTFLRERFLANHSDGRADQVTRRLFRNFTPEDFSLRTE
jgi:hypothetical protein